MRLVQILVPAGRRQAVVEILDVHGIEYGVTDETSDNEYVAVITFPLPAAAVEPILEELDEVGVDETACTVVLDAQAVLSRQFERLEVKYETDAEIFKKDGLIESDRIAREELQERAEELVSNTPTYVVLTLVSTVIATAGLLLDSAATIVGSMVIAPLIGPSMSASVGTVLNDRELFDRGVRMQLLGIAVAVVGATLFALLVRYFHLVPPGLEVSTLGEVSERATPDILALTIAIGAGIAGILSLMTGLSSALVGVMIAVALIPPAAAVGVGIAFGLPRLAVGAGIFVTVNVLSINLASLLTLWFSGYRPNSWFSEQEIQSTLLKRAAVLLLTIALVSVFLFGVTYDSYAAATTEDDIRSAVEDELEQAEVQLQLRSLTVERSGVVPPRQTDRVVVRIAVDPHAAIPQLVERLTDRVEAITNSPTAVEVEFTFVQQPTSNSPDS